MSTVNEVIIVHGFLSTPRHHWFRWFKAQCDDLTKHITILKMPDPRTPCCDSWLATLKERISGIGSQTWFIGHSLGCIAILRYLASLPANATVGGVILVSGFAEPVAHLPQLNAFTQNLPDLAELRQKIANRIAIVSLNDAVVPPELTLHLSKLLDADLYCFPKGGHFCDSDGYCTFPALQRLLERVGAVRERSDASLSIREL